MIHLDPVHGVNAHLCYCPRCGGESNELMLIGNRKRIYKCKACNTALIGFRQNEPCGKCKDPGPHEFMKSIEEGDKLPGHEPCDSCKKEMEQHQAIVQAGGVFWKCNECNRQGVIKAESPISEIVRQKMGIKAPEPVGIEFEHCKQHTA